MKKRILCLLSIIIIVPTLLFGCGVEEESSDVNIISDETVKFGALLPATDNTGKEIEAGLNYAYSLASSVNIGNKIDVDFVTEYYSNNEEVESKAKELVDSSVSAIVFYTDKLDCFNIFNDYIGETKVPVISLSPFTSDNENIFTISLTPKHLSSCAATYALENSYNNCAILLSRSDEFFENFAETYKNTLFSYVGFEPTVYYKEGEFANFSSSLLVSGNYEYLFLICSADEREDIVSNIRESGFVGEIMLTEVFDKSNIKSDLFNNCSFVSKLESDNANNVSTMFIKMFAEYSDINPSDVSSAAAYGYDAYMTAFEALKSFAPKGESSIFSDIKNNETAPSEVATRTEIKLSEYLKAFDDINYFGVTDVIAFTDNISVPNYIYVDKVSGADIQFSSKYTFSAENSSTE